MERRKRNRAVTSCVDCHRRKQKCDRGTPCSNCLVRGNRSVCRYETFPTGKGRKGEGVMRLQERRVPQMDVAPEKNPIESNPVKQLSIFGYSELSFHTSLSIFKAVDAAEPISFDDMPLRIAQIRNFRERYKASIGQLPPPNIVENLVAAFFKDVNWQFNPLDYDTFAEQMKDWNQLPFSDLNRSPEVIPTDVLFFPALLFQLLALALANRLPEHDDSLECMKFKAGMSLDDVANQYSDAGTNILILLGKRKIPKVAIQAGFLRTLFLKTTGLVEESWHSLGKTIEDARVLGWHLDATSEPETESGKTVRDLWDKEICRRTWINLCGWDVHMSMILGRPMRICLKDMNTILPIDTPAIQIRAHTAPIARIESEPPTPLTLQIFTHAIAVFVIRISVFLKENRTIKDFGMIQDLHDEILEYREHLPPYLWIENPDNRFDSHPECLWLPEARESLEATLWFAVLALHRQYIFAIRKSRIQALNAGLNILRCTRRISFELKIQHSRHFIHLFSNFDVAVTVGAIYALYPKESPRHLFEAFQNIELCICGFQQVASFNPLAKAAISVLQALCVRIQKGAMAQGTAVASTIPLTMARVEQGMLTPNNDSSQGIYSNNGFEKSTERLLDGSGETHAARQPLDPFLQPTDFLSQNAECESIDNDEFESIAPLIPIHDLLHNNLSSISVPNSSFQGSELFNSDLDWQFQGHFPSDTFWNLMNRTQFG